MTNKLLNVRVYLFNDIKLIQLFNLHIYTFTIITIYKNSVKTLIFGGLIKLLQKNC